MKRTKRTAKLDRIGRLNNVQNQRLIIDKLLAAVGSHLSLSQTFIHESEKPLSPVNHDCLREKLTLNRPALTADQEILIKDYKNHHPLCNGFRAEMGARVCQPQDAA